jgi:hypothetical protein
VVFFFEDEVLRMLGMHLQDNVLFCEGLPGELICLSRRLPHD